MSNLLTSMTTSLVILWAIIGFGGICLFKMTFHSIKYRPMKLIREWLFNIVMLLIGLFAVISAIVEIVNLIMY